MNKRFKETVESFRNVRTELIDTITDFVNSLGSDDCVRFTNKSFKICALYKYDDYILYNKREDKEPRNLKICSTDNLANMCWHILNNMYDIVPLDFIIK